MLVDVLLVVGDQGLGDGLADGVDLRGVATAGDAYADVNWGLLAAGSTWFRIASRGYIGLSLDS